jgi:hypothetical protein
MSKRQTIMVLGILVMVLAKLGFPPNLRDILYIVLGALIVFVSYRVKPDAPSKPKPPMPYVEHKKEVPAPAPEASVTTPETPTNS